MSRWDAPDVVRGFVGGEPNPRLLAFTRGELGTGPVRLLDIGCGAGRNAGPMAALGARVTGVDLARPMLLAARRHGALALAAASMDRLPFRPACFDAVVAHGIWNLARSAGELRAALAEAARVARPGAGLFVFTFSRSTLPAAARPVEGESFVYEQVPGEPQCFLAAAELEGELARAGFRPERLAEVNPPRPGALVAGPVFLEGVFRRA